MFPQSFESAVAAMKASVPIISVIPSAIREARAELEASEARAETLSGELQAAKSRASSLEDKLKNAEEKLKNAEKKRNKAEEKLLESVCASACP
jgi:predicted  nucleic acid-binding Zn-ribbon protein